MNNLLNGKIVKVFFKNGLTAEGRVRIWSPEISILDNDASPGYLVIQQTLDNVLMIRVLGEMVPENPAPITWREVVSESQLPPTTGSNLRTRAQQFAEARKQQIQQHKIQMGLHYQQGNVAGANTAEVRYEYPDFTKHKSIHRSKS